MGKKRGLLCQFNEFLVDGINSFKINTIVGTLPMGDLEDKNTLQANVGEDTSAFPHNIKYVITLDSDTNLVLGTALFTVYRIKVIVNDD